MVAQKIQTKEERTAISRRDVLRLISAAASGGMLVRPPAAVLTQTSTGRVLRIGLLGFQLGSHIPATAAVMEGIGEMPDTNSRT